jgi:uncharacterized protein YrrD
MRDIPLDAKVICTDGYGGRSSYVIINPISDQVTHIVVRQNGIHHTERLVPVALVKETTPDTIHLGCAKSELATMEPFIERRFIQRERPRYDQGSYLPYSRVVPREKMLVEIKFERIPRGELAVHCGADVYATDGRLGKVEKFLVDPSDKHITHLVVREGHLWNKRDVMLPVSAIDLVAKESVCLKWSKHAIEARSAGSIRRTAG